MAAKPKNQTISGVGGIPSGDEAGGLKILMASNFWLKWLQVGIRHERMAIDARAAAEAATRGSTEMAAAFDDEFQAGLVAITSVGFALDAFYNHVESLLVGATRVDKDCPEKADYVMQQLRDGFDLGKYETKWEPQVRRIYRLRNRAVHHESIAREAVPHPTGKSNVSKENVMYSLAPASAAVTTGVEVVTVCFAKPRSTEPDLVKWIEDAKHVPSYLADYRRHAHC